MIKIENTEVFGWEAAIRGMRNPMNSWEKSDSCYAAGNGFYHPKEFCFVVGSNDLKLMQNLCKAGNDHAKFMRMINVTCDITAPLYWWKEFDTYKVGTVANSCSTMHKIHVKEFDWDDFSCEHLMTFADNCKDKIVLDGANEALARVITTMNVYRDLYLRTKDKKYWWQMIQLLPSSYNQKRTVQLNYQVLKAFDSRQGHQLDEWLELLKWRNELPYFAEITGSK